MKFVAALIAAALALLCAPASRAETPEQAAAAICAARGRGASDLDIARVLQGKAPTVDFYEIEQLVLQAEREYCPRYLGTDNGPMPGTAPPPGGCPPGWRWDPTDFGGSCR
jgi:hypothetical protein